MRSAANLQDLEARADQVRLTLIGALVVVAILILFVVLLFNSVQALNDVHIADAGRDILLGKISSVPAGEPHLVDRNLGQAARFAAIALEISAISAIGVLIWALKMKRTAIACASVCWFIAISCAGPIPTTLQPTPPVAVSVPAARTLLGAREPANAAWLAEKVAWRRYMLAQIAYIEGHRLLARQLASRLQPVDLESPIEGDYRLALLGGQPHPPAACFKFGCLTSESQTWAKIIAGTLMVAMLGFAGLVFVTWRTIRRRLVLISDLVASRHQETVTAGPRPNAHWLNSTA